MPRLRMNLCFCAVALALGTAAGCVERRMVIVSDPPGAVVYDERNLPLGTAPVDRTFTYYGKYQFRLVKDGYETAVVQENIKAPWYEWPVFEFFSENLVPWTLRDVRYITVPMQPAQVIPAETVQAQAELLRARGQTIGIPLPPGPESLPTLPPPRVEP